MGGATGGAYANTISGTGMGLGAVLAREAIQNSVDAGRRTMIPEFACGSKCASSGGQRKEYITAAGLSDMRSRLSALKLPPSNCLANLGDDRYRSGTCSSKISALPA